MLPALPRVLTRILAIGLAIGLGLVMQPAAASGDPWTPIGPTGVGMVTAIVAGRTAVYAATCNGVYRSDDRGVSWREAGLPRQCVVRLAVDPRPDADTLYAIVDVRLYVGFRPEPTYMVTVGIFADSTLWVSRDGGNAWTQAPVLSGFAVGVDLAQPETAYVSTYDGRYAPLAVTHDSGATWTPVPDAPATIFSQIASDPRDGTLYGTSGYLSGYLSIYSGGSWSALAIDVTAVAVGSGSDGAVYAAGFEDFCRKTNAATWTCTSLPGKTVRAIAEIPASPPQPARILIGTFDGVWSSDDGGATFSRTTADAGYTPAVAVDSSAAAVYVGNDTGVYRSADRGGTWTNSSAGLSSTWVRALALDPADPSTILAGGEGFVYDVVEGGPGIFRSTDGGDSWTSLSVAGEPGYVFSLGIDPSNPKNLYTGSSSGGRVDRTSDGGVSWSTSLAFHGFVHGFAVDPSSSRVWVGDDQALRESSDGGATWSAVLTRDVFTVLFDSRHPGTIYAGEDWEEVGYYPYGDGYAVETSRDGGATWKRTGDETEGAVTAIATDPFSDDAVYAGTFAGAILRSPDAGATWVHWDSQYDGGPVWALVANPVRSGTLYLGGWAGVYRSTDGGLTWALFSEGLSPYGVFGLAITPDGEWLYAGTTGGGVFRLNLFVTEREPVSPASRPREPRTVLRR